LQTFVAANIFQYTPEISTSHLPHGSVPQPI